MQALGLIETRGLLPAIECVDVMLKTAQVELVERTFVGGGLVTITVTGDVGAVKAAVEAGVVAVENISHLSLVSQHVIPRPHEEIATMVGRRKELKVSNKDTSEEVTEKAKIPKESIEATPKMLKQLIKAEVDAFVQRFGLEKSLEVLSSHPVVKLRNLAREYKELGIVGRAISKANKELLLKKLREYYERGGKT